MLSSINPTIREASRAYRREHGANALEIELAACELREDARGTRVRLVDLEGELVVVLWYVRGAWSPIAPKRAA